MRDLRGLFAPNRVAVVGATDSDGSVGRAVTENLLADFDGEVIAVNPNRESVLGLECVPDLGATTDVDLAVVVVPARFVVEVVADAGEAGIENVVVITAGFSESGPEGARRERELSGVAAEYDITLVGPNSLGILSTPIGLNATFGPENAPAGSISFMSQSGAFITAVLDWAIEAEVGFRHVVSLGNKAVVDEVDLVRAWGADDGTDVVIGYLEGIDDGQAFIEAAREVIAETPILLVKSGRTEAGAKAASSHTGTLAGSERAYEAGLAQAGVVRADSVQDLFDAAQLLAGQPVPEDDRIAVVSNAGGPGVMTTDAIGDAELTLANFGQETIDGLESFLPEAANPYNPVDVIGDADLQRFSRAIDAVLADEGVDAAVVVSAPTDIIDYRELAETIVDRQKAHGKPVAASLMGGVSLVDARPVFHEAGLPNYFDPARAVHGLDAADAYRQARERPATAVPDIDVDRDTADAVFERARQVGDHRIGVEGMDLLAAYGIDVPAGTIADTPGEAEAAAREVGGGEPVVMKIVSPDILHKSDIGGVRVGVDPADARDAFEDLITRARSYQAEAAIRGVQVQAMADTDAGVETIVGINRDPQFGPLVLFGLGGVFVEVFEDTSLRVAPVDERMAGEMIEDLQATPLLRGARGREAIDEAAVRDAIVRVGRLATDYPQVLELDVNPLLVSPDGVTALDLRLTVEHDATGTGTRHRSDTGALEATNPPREADR